MRFVPKFSELESRVAPSTLIDTPPYGQPVTIGGPVGGFNPIEPVGLPPAAPGVPFYLQPPGTVTPPGTVPFYLQPLVETKAE